MEQNEVDKDTQDNLAEIDELVASTAGNPEKDLLLQEGMAKIDEDFYPRNSQGKFIGRHSKQWKKGQSGNPKGRPRPMVHLYGRFCQMMELTERELNELLKREDLTLADKAAVGLALKVSQEASWEQQKEVINREEGKIQDNIRIDVPPAPIRFVQADNSGRNQGLKLLEELEKGLEARRVKVDDEPKAAYPGDEVNNVNNVDEVNKAGNVSILAADAAGKVNEAS